MSLERNVIERRRAMVGARTVRRDTDHERLSVARDIYLGRR